MQITSYQISEYFTYVIFTIATRICSNHDLRISRRWRDQIWTIPGISARRADVEEVLCPLEIDTSEMVLW